MIYLQMKRRKYPCGICTKVFARPSRAKFHERNVHQQSVRHTSCSVCHKTLATRQSRRRHEKIVPHHIRPFQCQKCPKAFTVKSNLEGHKRSDPGEEKLKCPTPECEATFAYLWSMNEHKKKCGAVNLKVYVCPGCDKIFKHERSMKAHDQSTRHGKKSVCEICGEEFAYSNSLKKHLKRKH